MYIVNVKRVEKIVEKKKTAIRSRITAEKKMKGRKSLIVYIQQKRQYSEHCACLNYMLLLQEFITKKVQPAKAKRCISEIK